MSIFESIFEYPFLTKIFNFYLDDEDKLNFISCSKMLNSQKTKLRFNEERDCYAEDQDKWYFNCLTHIKISEIFEFPTSTKYFSIYFSTYTWKLSFIPDFITHLEFDDEFDKSIENLIPSSVTHLIFGKEFNKPIKNHLPVNLTHLTFGDKFGQSIENAIPKSVIYLKFGSFFDKPIASAENNLPENLQHLEFGCDFGQQIKNNIPKSVKYLNLGGYSGSIYKCIPKSVEVLIFGYEFDGKIKNKIPDSVKILNLGGYSRSIEGCIPNSVVELTLECFDKINPEDIPNSVVKLTIEQCRKYIKSDEIPESVRELIIGRHCGISIEFPDFITHLTLKTHNVRMNNDIPNSVTHLSLIDNFRNRDITNLIPNFVTHLILGNKFNQNLNDNIPDSVTHLTIQNYKYDMEIIKFPSNLKTLSCCWQFRDKYKDLIPKNVRIIEIDAEYEH